MLDQDTRVLPLPYNKSGRFYGEAEKALLNEVIERGSLTRWGGEMVDQLETEWCDKSRLSHTIATSSGTTALHTAIAALGIEPGRHVMTSPVTDMGSILAILQNGLIPVFADIDPCTGMISAESVETLWTDKCAALLFVQLFGRCADLTGLKQFVEDAGGWLIEDASQAHFAENAGVLAGQAADIAAFSLQQSKVISCGEGGLVCTHSQELADAARLYQNKGWLREQKGNRAYPTLGHNFRMPELSAAVALGQLRQVDRIMDARTEAYNALAARLHDQNGWRVNLASRDERPSWWMFAMHNASLSSSDIAILAERLSNQGLPFSHGYIGTDPIFTTDVLAKQRGIGQTRFPWALDPDYVSPVLTSFPGAIAFQQHSLTFPMCEGLSAEDTDYIAAKALDVLG